MARRIVSEIMLALLSIGMLVLAPNIQPAKADPTTVYVWSGNITGPCDGSLAHPYQNITSGLAHAADYDTVFVFNGTYHETQPFRISKTISLVGQNHGNTIIDGSGIGTVINIDGNNVTVANFMIQNSGSVTEDAGIYLGAPNASIRNNVIANCSRGISLSNSQSNTLAKNLLENNTCGINLDHSSNNTLSDNTIRHNSGLGIRLYYSDNSRIYDNSFIDNANQTEVILSYNTAWDRGYLLGGNYWSDYSGVDLAHGPGQNESGSDGIGDTPYNVTADGKDQDHYPHLLRVNNIDTGLSYWRIQDTIDADETKDGHTIEVNASIYYEHVTVYKSLALQVENGQTAIIDGSRYGTVLDISASNVSVSNFTIQNGDFGVHLDGAGNAVLRNNNMTNNRYNFFVEGTVLSDVVNDVDSSNWVDGKHILYLVNNQSITVSNSTDVAYLALINCSGIAVENLSLTGNGQGLLLAFTNGSSITHVNAWGDFYGIHLFSSSGNNITGSNITYNDDSGVILNYSPNNRVTSNDIEGNELTSYGINLLNSNNNDISSNSITDCTMEISVSDSSGNNVTGNNVTRSIIGIYFGSSQNSKATNNMVTNNTYSGIVISFCSNIDVAMNNVTDSNNFGIYLLTSSGTRLSGNNVNGTNSEGSNAVAGVRLEGCASNNSFTDNTVANNKNGVQLLSSNGSYIVGNSVTSNTLWGISLSGSSNNVIYHNNFTKNAQQATVDSFTNTWDGNYLLGGNYWDQLTDLNDTCHSPGNDSKQTVPGSDGIWDTEYTINSTNKDRYPLTKPYCGPHDIGISGIDLSRSCLVAGKNTTITIKVTNYGHTTSAETINVTVRVLNATHYAVLTVTFSNVTQSRNSNTTSFIWTTTGQTIDVYTIEANATPVQGETCITDNTNQANCTVSYIGDVNGDLKVEATDVGLVIRAYATRQGYAKWNASADINWDNKVDASDIGLVIRYYEKQVP